MRLINFTLEHGYRWLAGDPLHTDFWSPPIFHPHPGVSAYTDVLLGVGPIYWLSRLAGVAPDVAFHLWILAIWSLNFAAFWWLLRRGFGVGPLGSAAGAFLFAFGAWRQLNVIHQQLMPSFYLVLALGALVRLFRDDPADRPPGRGVVWIVLFFGSLPLQAWTAFYPLYFFCLTLAAAAVWALVLPGPRRRLAAVLRRHALPAAAAAVVAAALVTPLALRYLDAAHEVGLRNYPEARVPRPASWLLMGQTHRLYGGLQRPGGVFRELRSTTHSNGAGLLTTLVALAGLWRLRRRPGVALLALSVFTVIATVTVWPGDVSGWRLLYRYLPGAAALRAVGRVGMILLPVAALGVAGFFDRPFRGRWRIAAGLLAILCLAEQLHVIAWRDRQELREHVAGIAARISPERCEAFLLVSRGQPRYGYADEDAAWAALATGVPTVNGRYGNQPPGWGLDKQHITGRKKRRRLERQLRRWARTHGMDREAICWIEITRFPERVGIERRE